MGYLLSWDIVNLLGRWNIEPYFTYAEDQAVGLWLMVFDLKRLHRPNLFINRPGSHANMYAEDCTYGNVTAILVHYMRNEDWQNIEEGGTINLPCSKEMGIPNCDDPYRQPVNLEILRESLSSVDFETSHGLSFCAYNK